jgi:hypothetical protein
MKSSQIQKTKTKTKNKKQKTKNKKQKTKNKKQKTKNKKQKTKNKKQREPVHQHLDVKQENNKEINHHKYKYEVNDNLILFVLFYQFDFFVSRMLVCNRLL